MEEGQGPNWGYGAKVKKDRQARKADKLTAICEPTV
jgi:hypothetical protein